MQGPSEACLKQQFQVVLVQPWCSAVNVALGLFSLSVLIGFLASSQCSVSFSYCSVPQSLWNSVLTSSSSSHLFTPRCILVIFCVVCFGSNSVSHHSHLMAGCPLFLLLPESGTTYTQSCSSPGCVINAVPHTWWYGAESQCEPQGNCCSLLYCITLYLSNI